MATLFNHLSVRRSNFVGQTIQSQRVSGVVTRKAISVRADVNYDAFRELPYRTIAKAKRASSPDALHPFHSQVLQYDYIVIGSGIAGLTYALKVAEYGRVAIITKDQISESCTAYAQGGVCAVLDPLDSVSNHVQDTMVAGGFLNDAKAVHAVCAEGAARVLELAKLGSQFTQSENGDLHLTKEGGHSHRRIVHAADTTGAEIERALVAQTRAHAQIDIFEHHVALDLVVLDQDGTPHCFGVDVLDTRTYSAYRFLGLSTLLASGGAGQLYPSTTNPSVTTGDGIAMAYRANVAVGNMEFIQFHPTALYNPDEEGRCFLISEAVRGEGGLLFNLAGERFMPMYDDRAELAPRDVVARAIHEQVTLRGDTHVLLDISHMPEDEVLAHFPAIAAKCASIGIDITKDPIPVLPAQHYLCGGVQTGLRGDTSIPGLFACGEVAFTGLHGANRLASNSLLEGLVFAHRAVSPSVAHADHAAKSCGLNLHYAAASADFSGAKAPRMMTPRLNAWAADVRASLRALMWRVAGIERTDADMRSGLSRVKAMRVEVEATIANYGVNQELVELQSLVTCGELVLTSGIERRESRGLHSHKDFPEARPEFASPTILQQFPAPTVQELPSLGAPVREPLRTLPPSRNANIQRIMSLRSTDQDLM